MILTQENQVFSLNRLQIQSFIDDIRSLSLTSQKLLNGVIQQNLYFYRQNKIHYQNQTTLGEYAEVGRQWTNTLLQELQDYTFISWWKRGGKQSCVYEIHPYFFIPEVQERLSAYFSTVIFTLKALISAPVQDTTQLNIEYLYKIFNSNLTDSKRVQKRPRFVPKQRRLVMSSNAYNEIGYSKPQKEEHTYKPPSHKVWEPEVRGIEDPFEAAKNFQKIKEQEELLAACDRFGFGAEIRSCMNNRFKNILDENRQKNKLE
jgi:hypothetical protein